MATKTAFLAITKDSHTLELGLVALVDERPPEHELVARELSTVPQQVSRDRDWDENHQQQQRDSHRPDPGRVLGARAAHRGLRRQEQVCVMCAPGYGKTSGVECSPCPTDPVARVVVFDLLMILMLTAYVYRLRATGLERLDKHMIAVKILFTGLQVNSFVLNMRVQIPTFARNFFVLQGGMSQIGQVFFSYDCASSPETPLVYQQALLYLLSPLIVITGSFVIYIYHEEEKPAGAAAVGEGEERGRGGGGGIQTAATPAAAEVVAAGQRLHHFRDSSHAVVAVSRHGSQGL